MNQKFLSLCGMIAPVLFVFMTVLKFGVLKFENLGSNLQSSQDKKQQDTVFFED